MLEKKSIVSVKCSDIMSDQNVKLAGHIIIQNLVGQCPMTDCYIQLWDCLVNQLTAFPSCLTNFYRYSIIKTHLLVLGLYKNYVFTCLLCPDENLLRIFKDLHEDL